MFTSIIPKLKLNNVKDKSLNNKRKNNNNSFTLKEKSFSKKEKKIINKGTSERLLFLKQRNPEKFICSNCQHSITNSRYKSCTLFKRTILDENQECYSCTNMKV